MNDIAKIFKDAGYVTVEGINEVKRLIRVVADNNEQPLCSGYGVFPDGTKCPGCGDCNEG